MSEVRDLPTNDEVWREQWDALPDDEARWAWHCCVVEKFATAALAPERRCDCWKYERQVCDVCQGWTGEERDAPSPAAGTLEGAMDWWKGRASADAGAVLRSPKVRERIERAAPAAPAASEGTWVHNCASWRAEGIGCAECNPIAQAIGPVVSGHVYGEIVAASEGERDFAAELTERAGVHPATWPDGKPQPPLRLECNASGYSFVIDNPGTTTGVAVCPWHGRSDCLTSPPASGEPQPDLIAGSCLCSDGLCDGCLAVIRALAGEPQP